MLTIGLTGGVASGKSTVANLFAAHGATIISADKIAKALTKQGMPAYYAIVKHMGKNVLTTAQELNRQYLRKIIFTNRKEKLWLENLLHPLIRAQIKHEIQAANTTYCIVEIPLLTSKEDYPYLNRILLVTTSPEQQLTRLITRDKSSLNNAQAMIQNQPSDTIRRTIADDILINNGSLETLEQQVMELHFKYSSK